MMRLSIVLLLIGFGFLACQQKASETFNANVPPPKTFMDSVSYMIGYDMGKGMRNDSMDARIDYIALGFNKGFKGDSSLLTASDVEKLRQKFQDMMMKAQDNKRKMQEEQIKKDGATNKEKSEKFLAENKTKPGIITTESGLQYQVIKEGTGKTAKTDELVKVHIKAYYMDGKQFDNTYERGEPVQLLIDQQVQGWKEALTKMKEGAIWKVFVPPSLGWGEKGSPPTIPPAAVTIFEMELVKVVGPPDKNQMAPPPGMPPN